MAYIYLLDLYRALAERKHEIARCEAGTCNSLDDERYRLGRLAAIDDFAEFLKENYHAKLPRRLQKEQK